MGEYLAELWTVIIRSDVSGSLTDMWAELGNSFRRIVYYF